MDVERAIADLRSGSWEVAVQAAECLRATPGDDVSRALAAALNAHDTAITEAAAVSLILRDAPGTVGLLWQALSTLDDDATDHIWDVVDEYSDHPISRALEQRYRAR
ncbi:hypothetical protein DSM112329_02825 [Paraconexibacter sp. AEG42_29]|uniref:HEAT repeat domain-containing protein n=1 Tax=Paraconexibacter sp. AEG42_29 TaxID=2997339 RepID=A0AAU7AWE7_9ACTN